MRLLLRYLTELYEEERAKAGLISAVRRLGRASGALRYSGRHAQLFRLDIFRNYVGRREDKLFHVSHNHYLSTTLTYSQRIECALHHYRYEDQNYDAVYKDAVYCNGGLLLWSTTVDGTV